MFIYSFFILLLKFIIHTYYLIYEHEYMRCFECYNYTIVLWYWIDCGSLNRYVCLYLAGMLQYLIIYNSKN